MIMKPSHKAIFLDRDGVINQEVDYLSNPDDLKLIDGVIPALKIFKKLGYKLVVITNQSGIARGILTEVDLSNIHIRLKEILKIDSIDLDGIYFCPHHPDINLSDGVKKYLMDCTCRKPNNGMLLQAQQDLNIDFSSSFLVGDSLRDIQSGNLCGIQGFGVKTGKGCPGLTDSVGIHLNDLLDVAIYIQNNFS
ncbi:MAG: D-glycero-beta-D-manno-heptose 1,7-bisphosphate 7-phosphatase [Candidatus Cloacimonetes bacterium]|nr:D-glycero-beta-D-manno-heptose 1,7-bisphosphate 7-phosphatase [Candidatus Cloacimonadota bacterium]